MANNNYEAVKRHRERLKRARDQMDDIARMERLYSSGELSKDDFVSFVQHRVKDWLDVNVPD